jgi:ribosomal protein S18 acetylase RimI-like enzyme
MTQDVRIIDADLGNPAHGAALIKMMDAYLRDPMELGRQADERIKRDLVPGLRANQSCRVFLAYRGRRAIGFSICFLGFSTFNVRPLINIHDMFVDPAARGAGVAWKLLERIEALARELGCCRISLEVREDNTAARALYRKFGFDQGVLGPDRVRMEFWAKPL